MPRGQYDRTKMKKKAVPGVVKVPSKKALAKEEVMELTRRGAKVRLYELELEMQKLRIFLGLTQEEQS